jgi:hypothetical protein
VPLPPPLSTLLIVASHTRALVSTYTAISVLGCWALLGASLAVALTYSPLAHWLWSGRSRTSQDDLGKGLGPGLVALLISGTNRVTAFNIALWAWAPCAFFQLLLLFTLSEDEQTLQEALQQQSNDRDANGSCVELAVDG